MSALFAINLAGLGFEATDSLILRPEPEYLVGGLLSQDALAVLYGPPGTGKTLITIDLMFHVGLGLDWLERSTQQATVAYFYGEGGSGMAKRVALWLQAHEVSPEDCPVIFSQALPNLGDDGEVESFINRMTAFKREGVVRHPLRMVVFDTLARCIVGVEESSNTAMGQVVANAERIRDELGVAVLLVHHTGKDTTRGMRGASALLGAIETALVLSSDGDSGVFMEVEKQKDGPDGEVFRFGKHPGALPDGRQSCMVRFEGMKAGSGNAANDNRPSLGKNQKEMVEIIEGIDPQNQGVAWPGVQEKAKERGGPWDRTSTASEVRDSLLEKGVLRQDGDLLFRAG